MTQKPRPKHRAGLRFANRFDCCDKGSPMKLFDDIRAGESPGFDAIYEALLPTFPLYAELKNTPQEPDWHGEGDVHIHTTMVVDEIYRAIAEHDREIAGEERLTLVLGAALHDIGKPLTTREAEIKGRTRIVAKRHDDRGRSYIAYALHTLGLEPSTVAGIMAIVGHHHDPKRLLRKDQGAERFRRLARLASLEHLYLAELADMRGRICADKAQQLDTVELFKLTAEDHGLFGTDDPYADWRAEIDAALDGHDDRTRSFVLGAARRAHEAGEIYAPAEEIAKSYNYREDYAHLVVLCGPSACGKSEWVAQNTSSYDVVSLDALREELTGDASDQSMNGQVRQLSKERLKQSLRANRDVVWDATNLRRDFRGVPTRLGYDYGAFVTLVVFQTDLATTRKRNTVRDRSVPDEVLQKQYASAEFPYLDEAHEVVWV
jgi:predicted kinase